MKDTKTIKDVLHVVKTKKATGTIVVLDSFNNQNKGEIIVDGGKIVSISYQGKAGKPAFILLGQLNSPHVDFIKSTPKERYLNSKSKDFASLKSPGWSIRSKMFTLFSILPAVVLLVLSAFYLHQLSASSSLLAQNSEEIVRSLAEREIKLRAQSAADEVDRYLLANPEFDKSQFQTTPEFRKIAEQPVGETGYTSILEGPFDPGDLNSVWWTHPNEKLIGVSFYSVEKALGVNFAPIKAIIDRVPLNNGQTEGYYRWQDKDGEFRDKYISSVRIGDTPFYMTASTYMNDFTLPILELKEKIDTSYSQTRWIVIVVFFLSSALFVLVVTSYSSRLSNSIKEITLDTEKISLGDIESEVSGMHRKDELGTLSRSVERLRRSTQITLKRLRSASAT